MISYMDRVAESEIRSKSSYLGAILVEGAKAVGKTETAKQFAKTTYRMDVDQSARESLATYPDQLFNSPTPVLFDEWQDTPELWNLVRHAVDDRAEKGLYLLAGSSRPRDTATMHSGAGRIGRVRMRPMSLFESGHSTGAVSLAALLRGEDPEAPISAVTIPELVERVVLGGWPETINLSPDEAIGWLQDYLQNLVEVDIPELGPRRNPGKLNRLMAALGRASATQLNHTALAKEVGGVTGPIRPETLNGYLGALERLMLIEPLPAWQPHMRSRTRLRTRPVHHFTDPAIGLMAMGVNPTRAMADLSATGLQFESMVLRDLRIYAQQLNPIFSSWRDTFTGNEVDVVIELIGGTWAAVEVKLGEAKIEEGAQALLNMANKVDKDQHGEPSALIVVTGGRFSYKRPDGVTVVPITQLGP